jgi:membrane magnesium transporter 1
VDIQVETIIAVALSCLGLVLGSPSLKPISWSTWAGKIEKGDKEAGFNPFAGLEERVGFMDIRV